MKKYIKIIITVMLVMTMLAGCGQTSAKKDNSGSEKTEKKLSVVTTIFPEYDWVKEIAGESKNVDITMLLNNGVDLHSFQPTTDDIMKISKCDLFIYVGGESDEWVEDALAEATNKDMKVINLLDVLGDSIKEEEVKEGMQSEEEEEESDSEEKEEPEYDEHVWLSLKNARILCGAIADSLCEIDPDSEEKYKKNVSEYQEKLTKLDKQYQEVVDQARQKTVLFGDRFPFRYLVDDYGLDYYAAFVGCSAESEASFKTIKFLAEKVDELKISSILQIETADGSIAKTIINNTKNKNQKILTLDSMQATTSEDVENGASYFPIMEQNQKVLEDALK